MARKSTLFLLLSLICTMQTLNYASAKVANCKTRFTKKTHSDYCTKFGVM